MASHMNTSDDEPRRRAVPGRRPARSSKEPAPRPFGPAVPRFGSLVKKQFPRPVNPPRKRIPLPNVNPPRGGK